jgi:hypothetical protein
VSGPKRIQLRRTKGWRIPAGAVIVDRRTRWGNPYLVGVEDQACNPRDAAECVRLFRYSIEHWWQPEYAEHVRAELAGKDLACWCKPGDPCHADVLLEVANTPAAPVPVPAERGETP